MDLTNSSLFIITCFTRALRLKRSRIYKHAKSMMRLRIFLHIVFSGYIWLINCVANACVFPYGNSECGHTKAGNYSNTAFYIFQLELASVHLSVYKRKLSTQSNPQKMKRKKNKVRRSYKKSVSILERYFDK